jgi:hypothetical protein
VPPGWPPISIVPLTVRNFDEMQAELAAGSPNWAGIAAILGDAGITDRDGNRPTAGTVEETWRLACKAIAGGSVKPDSSRDHIEGQSPLGIDARLPRDDCQLLAFRQRQTGLPDVAQIVRAVDREDV